MMATERTLILPFRRDQSLGERNELFRTALFKFVDDGKGTRVHLLKEGFAPVDLAVANDFDVVACDALAITGTLR